MKPICVRCRRFYKPKRNGFYFVEGRPMDGERYPRPGIEHDSDWQDYKLWIGDLWECQGCGQQIISGVGIEPLREHYHDDFDAIKQRVGATIRINDC